MGTEQGLGRGCLASQSTALFMLPQCLCWFCSLFPDILILLCLLCHTLYISSLQLKISEQILKSDCLGFNNGPTHQLGGMEQGN